MAGGVTVLSEQQCRFKQESYAVMEVTSTLLPHSWYLTIHKGMLEKKVEK